MVTALDPEAFVFSVRLFIQKSVSVDVFIRELAKKMTKREMLKGAEELEAWFAGREDDPAKTALERVALVRKLAEAK